MEFYVPFDLKSVIARILWSQSGISRTLRSQWNFTYPLFSEWNFTYPLISERNFTYRSISECNFTYPLISEWNFTYPSISVEFHVPFDLRSRRNYPLEWNLAQTYFNSDWIFFLERVLWCIRNDNMQRCYCKGIGVFFARRNLCQTSWQAVRFESLRPEP